MPITSYDYVPILKWRQGEYQALLRLRDPVKDSMVPLLEMTPPDFDFELGMPTKTLDEHLVTFAPRFRAKWGGRLALLDCSLLSADDRMSDGTHPMQYLCEQATANGAHIIPTITLESDQAYRQAVFVVDEQTLNGVALRFSLEEALDPDFGSRISQIMSELVLEPDELDLILDLKTPNFDPVEGLAEVVVAALTSTAIFNLARSVILASTSFPESMASVTGPIQFWPRREWGLYKAVLAALPSGSRTPRSAITRLGASLLLKETCVF